MQLRRFFLGFALLLLAACQTPGPTGGPGVAANPHYKVGTPYEVAGRWYYPKVDKDYDVIGTASWYGDEFQGKPTANGEVFDKKRLTAAHTTLPLPTLVEVQNLENGRRVIVRVNDRGPFVGDRVIDLSHAAATYLGYADKGLARVRVRYVGDAELYAEAPFAPKTGPAPDQPVVARADQSTIERLIVDETVLGPEAATANREIWIDVASFANMADLQALAAKLKQRAPVRVASAYDATGKAAHTLQMGPYYDTFAAQARVAALQEEGYTSAHIAR